MASILDEISKRRERFKQIVEERPYAAQIMQMEILYDIASLLSKIEKSTDESAERLVRIENAIRETQPQGFLGDEEFIVTDQLKEYDPPDNWFSMSVYNYGPNTVYLQINDPTRRFVALRIDESTSPDFKTAKIDKIFFRCDTGETATVKTIGKY